LCLEHLEVVAAGHLFLRNLKVHCRIIYCVVCEAKLLQCGLALCVCIILLNSSTTYLRCIYMENIYIQPESLRLPVLVQD